MNAAPELEKGVILEIDDLLIEGVAKGKTVSIVQGISLSLCRGEVLGLIGESGAGKSTLGLAAMGFVRRGCRITSGSIRFDGADMLSGSGERQRRLRGAEIAYVAQSAAAAFNPAHRLINQFAEGPVHHGKSSRTDARERGIELYRQMHIPNPANFGFRYPHQVSGGQLQRAMTAMAMSCQPKLIIFDEPTTALDVTTQIEVLSAIRDIVARYNTAAIYISHDLAVVAQMADRVIVLRHGRMIEQAETRQMLSAPQEKYTRSLWSVREFRSAAKPAPTIRETPVLDIVNVHVRFGQTIAVDNASIRVHKGRTVAVVGESGAGKTTVARVASGLVAPASGNVLLEGKPVSPLLNYRSAEERRQIQFLHQMADTAMNPTQRVRDIIGRPLEMFLGLSGRKKIERVREYLSLLGLEPDGFIDRFPAALSGGQKQRICLARALAAEPKFIICDEITSALDQLVAENILQLLIKLQQEFSLSYLYITHDLSTVRAIADDVVVMHQGRLVRSGTKDKVLAPPFDEYTQTLLSSVPEMNPDWLTTVLSSNNKSETGGGRAEAG